jgi:hypothetical protein
LNYAAVKFWIDVLVLAVVAGNTVYTWWTNREKVTNKRFKEAEDRILQLESDVKHPPSCTYHPRLEERMDQAVGKLERMDGKIDGLSRAVDLMNEFLINQGGKR